MLRMLLLSKNPIFNKTLKTLTQKVILILKEINHRKKICQKAKENLLLRSHKLNPKQNLKQNLKEDPLLNQKTKNKDPKVQKNNLIFTTKWTL